MAKKTSFANYSPEELERFAQGKREELRGLRFSSSGSKNRNVKLGKALRHEIARALTEQNGRKSK